VLRGLTLALVAVVAGGWAPAAADEAPFSISVVAGSGRTVAAEIPDLDGDGRADLMIARFEGLPLDDRRTLRVHFQDAEGGFAASPDLVTPLPPGIVAFDVADVLPAPGVELIFLVRDGALILSFAGRKVSERAVPVPGGATAGPAVDERGLSRLALVSFAFGPEPLLVLPGLGDAYLMRPSGSLLARLDVGGRANYYVQPQGLIYAESDLQLFFDVPRVSVGDIDGDGRADVLSSGRHDLRIFLQRQDGSFQVQPDRQLSLGRVSMEDHMRGSGSVRTLGRDIDGDGRLDLMISETEGGFTNAASATSIYFNKAGTWDLGTPDLSLGQEKIIGADQLLDFDGNGELELLQGRIPVTVFEIAEVFLTRSFDAHMAIYRLMPSGSDPPVEPSYERKLGIPIDFDTGRLRGFIPSFRHDLNGDGYLDFFHSTDGSGIEIFLGNRKLNYRKRAARQALPTSGVLRSGDLDADGLPDFVLCNPRKMDAPVQVLRNRGILPGTLPRVGPVPES
jgi:hypothetical protein